MTLRRHLPIVVLVGFLAVAAANTIFAVVEESPTASPFQPRHEGNFAHAVLADSRTARRFYDVYLRVGEVAPDAALVIPPGGPLNPYDAFTLMRAPVVVDRGYDPRLSAQEAGRLLRRAAAQGVYWERGSQRDLGYAVVASDGERIRLMRHGRALFIADEAVLREVGVDWRAEP